MAGHDGLIGHLGFGELTLDTLNLGSAFFIGTFIRRLLQPATGWTLDRSG
jgi:hypothetical protein